MKKILIVALTLLVSASFSTADAAKKKKKKNEVKVDTVVVKQPVVLTNGSDTLSYAAGMMLTKGLKPYLQQSLGVDTAYMADFMRGFEEMLKSSNDPKMKAYAAGIDIANQLNKRMLPGMEREFTDTPDTIIAETVHRGFTDALEGDTTVMHQQYAEQLFQVKQMENREAKEEKLYGPNRDAGRKFLAENAKKEGVITTPSGLQYKVLTQGEGEVPQLTDKVLVHYEGRLVDGTVFDASSKHGTEPSSFQPNQVIPGWKEALTMMPVGSKWQLYIPYELAYGEREAGQIKPFSALIFDVELVGIDKPKAETTASSTKKTTAKKPATAARKKTAKRK